MEQDKKQMHTVEDFIIRLYTSKLRMCVPLLCGGGTRLTVENLIIRLYTSKLRNSNTSLTLPKATVFL